MNNKIRNKIKNCLLFLQIKANLARKKFIVEIILAIIASRKIQFQEISLHIESEAKVDSTERRIQAFFADFEFNYEEIASFLLVLCPKGKLTLCMDRTEWDFGKFQCNILMITARCEGVGIPLFWELLDNKSGNSHALDRIDLLEKCVNLLGINRIGMLIADREFIGHKWLKWLKNNKIPFCIRVPKNHSIGLKNGEVYFIHELLSLKDERLYEGCLVDGIVCNIYIRKLENEDYLFLIGTEKSRSLGSIYRHRWSIEVCFQAMKSRGFNLEDTHLKEGEKIKKLLVFVSIALALCINLGIFLHMKIKKIRLKKHKYKAKSFFRNGLDSLRKLLQGKEKESEKDILKAIDLLWKLIRIKLQISDYQYFKNIG